MTAPDTESREDTRTRAEVVTFGCRLNAYESEVIRENLTSAGRDNVIVVNTCAVTAEAERQARQAIRRLRRDHPEAEIVVTGCAAQIDPARFAGMEAVDRVVGNREKLERATFADPAADPTADTEPVRVADIMTAEETAGHLIGGFEGRARAFVQVQNGCDHRCTFCIIPYGRGNSRSVPAGAVVEQIRQLVANGYKEVVLTGVDITSWGGDLPGHPPLGDLVRRILKLVPDLPRLRISSIDCIEMDEPLFRAIADEPRLMPHFHLSLQAGDDMILKRMKRRHGRDDALALIRRIRDLRPEAVFGADLIAGFPTETEAMFANTARIVEEAGLTWLHVFPYSERPGTPAARIPNKVPKALRKERAAHLRALGAARERAYLESLVGSEAEVLVEGDGIGRTEGFAPVRLDPTIADGSLLKVAISGLDETGARLLGRPV
ncbi:tRNA (N(6)-L-threonylcarbamoyladenosine(37)-C(2))-methylthiotransferase MtaB [Marivibrio halodurans]|uniref:tRNA (N(6)-L-threonylcarbamoyladenosine(37)-C(2))-methylthiotransferase MtaB n=1 Tax=Marivibrio halodurans TaxID=2039722 RepID=A0A8J7SQ01_9PROT|nr:tRNA (N(6)-L-threonylcarbamoyladenosine(37)-C(2))-methylthiotransferase MtaB [Marivibrio halodurans]MBP5858948.1 tRNA (N(6)-L-threonylcarbamoyladenosine(37)-C(2))-methylthiotransferase MtaB [Marivibrio halodurans]